MIRMTFTENQPRIRVCLVIVWMVNDGTQRKAMSQGTFSPQAMYADTRSLRVIHHCLLLLSCFLAAFPRGLFHFPPPRLPNRIGIDPLSPRGDVTRPGRKPSAAKLLYALVNSNVNGHTNGHANGRTTNGR